MIGHESMRAALIVDTNLLLLLVVGAYAPEQIDRFKRTRAYLRNDYLLLLAFAREFRRVLVTPNLLTEVSNLAGQLSEPVRSRVFVSFAALTRQVDERYFASSDLVGEADFLRFGLADTSVIAMARERIAVITDDLPLYVRLTSAGVQVTNFNHIRVAAAE